MKSSRNSALEGLRGLAAIMVLFCHIGVMFYPAFFWGGELTHCNNFDLWFGQTPFQFFMNGNSGVAIFLFLTGYGSYQVYSRGNAAVSKFLILRYFKLLALIVLSTAGIFICAKIGFVYYQQAAMITNTNWLEDYNPAALNYVHVLMNDPMVSAGNYNTALWTMKYLFVGAGLSILFCEITKNVRHIEIIVVMALFIFWNLDKSYYICCILGVCLAKMDSMAKLLNERLYAEILLIIAGIYFAAFPTGMRSTEIFYGFLPWSVNIAPYYHFLGVFLIMTECLYGRLLKKVFELRFFQFLGKYSSAIYATHIGVIVSLSGYLFLKLYESLEYNQAVGITIIISLIVVVLFSMLIDYLIRWIYKIMGNIYDSLIKGTDH